MVAIDLIADSSNVGHKTTFNALNLCHIPEIGFLDMTSTGSHVVIRDDKQLYYGSLCGFTEIINEEGLCKKLDRGYF